MLYAILHHPEHYTRRSGLFPLVEALGARPLFYHLRWEAWQRRSWTAGQWLRAWGGRYYGSAWNGLTPWVDEARLAWQARAGRGDVIHFLFGEFAAPRHPRWFRRGGARLAGTFHCSARRLPQVLKGYRCWASFDRISVMSRSQIPYLLEQGVPADRIEVTLHGVDTRFFAPDPERSGAPDRPLRLALVGSTERDHDFAAAVMRGLGNEAVTLEVLTARVNQPAYQGLGQVHLLGNLPDEGLRDLYRSVDLLLMPMLDCTANNAVLEAMACGTPVMVNRVGGIPEYVDDTCNVVLPGKETEAWVDTLRALVRDRTPLIRWRPAVRAWAEGFDWSRTAQAFQAFHRRLLEVA